MWQFRGQQRPPFAVEPRSDQESVWDYPRPPALVPDSRRVQVKCGDFLIADSQNTYRILETASPPTFYIPPEDIRREWLELARGQSYCEWKGAASYYDIQGARAMRPRVAWTYHDPTPAFVDIAHYIDRHV